MAFVGGTLFAMVAIASFGQDPDDSIDQPQPAS